VQNAIKLKTIKQYEAQNHRNTTDGQHNGTIVQKDKLSLAAGMYSVKGK